MFHSFLLNVGDKLWFNKFRVFWTDLSSASLFTCSCLWQLKLWLSVSSSPSRWNPLSRVTENRVTENRLSVSSSLRRWNPLSRVTENRVTENRLWVSSSPSRWNPLSRVTENRRVKGEEEETFSQWTSARHVYNLFHLRLYNIYHKLCLTDVMTVPLTQLTRILFFQNKSSWTDSKMSWFYMKLCSVRFLFEVNCWWHHRWCHTDKVLTSCDDIDDILQKVYSYKDWAVIGWLVDHHWGQLWGGGGCERHQTELMLRSRTRRLICFLNKQQQSHIRHAAHILLLLNKQKQLLFKYTLYLFTFNTQSVSHSSTGSTGEHFCSVPPSTLVGSPPPTWTLNHCLWAPPLSTRS